MNYEYINAEFQINCLNVFEVLISRSPNRLYCILFVVGY